MNCMGWRGALWTVRGPGEILTDFHFFVIKPTRRTSFPNLFFHEALHVSDSSSVHHQIIHCTHSNGVCHTVTVHSAMGCVIQALYTQLSSRSICWWWTEQLSETCRVSCRNKFAKLVRLVGFIIKKFVTTQAARSHERTVTIQRGHMNVLSRYSAVTWTYCHDTARSPERTVTIQRGHMNVLSRYSAVTWTYCHDTARSHERTVTIQLGHMNVQTDSN
jgi:hypothetical protein